MDYSLQSKLLRVLEENEADVIGENRPQKVDVRIIAATNRNIRENIQHNKFRKDLFHRINVFEIHIPPLSYHFIKIFNEIYNKKVLKISKQVEGILINQKWTDNVRELKNTIEKN